MENCRKNFINPFLRKMENYHENFTNHKFLRKMFLLSLHKQCAYSVDIPFYRKLYFLIVNNEKSK